MIYLKALWVITVKYQIESECTHNNPKINCLTKLINIVIIHSLAHTDAKCTDKLHLHTGANTDTRTKTQTPMPLTPLPHPEEGSGKKEGGGAEGVRLHTEKGHNLTPAVPSSNKHTRTNELQHQLSSSCAAHLLPS